MKEDKDKKLDAFIRKAVIEVGLENPTVDFTRSVLSKIQADAQKSTAFVYRPLISKSVWLMILTAIAGVFVYSIWENPSSEISWLAVSKLNRFAEFNLLANSLNFYISNTVIYSFVGLAFFVWVQVFLLKSYMNKRIAL
ncbi:hypothetical protein MNBD_BACTEROID03-16 [hydrothermal vent metagenome]|uniref:Uncharacterized protein n=1 Tax=hydrothermal vent metagenome TaxID=652676 RepID=A0A3B0TQI8_9ZZZZ